MAIVVAKVSLCKHVRYFYIRSPHNSCEGGRREAKRQCNNCQSERTTVIDPAIETSNAKSPPNGRHSRPKGSRWSGWSRFIAVSIRECNTVEADSECKTSAQKSLAQLDNKWPL